MEGPWPFLSAVAAAVVGVFGALITGRANRLSKQLELTSPSYAALAERVTTLETDAARHDDRFRELREAAERRDQQIRDLARRVDGLVIENAQLKSAAVVDKARESELEQRVQWLQDLVRSILDGIAAILVMYQDNPTRLPGDALARLTHLLQSSEARVQEFTERGRN